MPEKHTVKANKRTVFGKKNKHLRKNGLMPANIYGKDVESTAIELPVKEFVSLFKTVGETGLVYVQVDGQDRPTLIQNVQVDFVTHEPIHADFYQVNLKEKVKAMIPVELVGEPTAEKEKVGLLLHTLNEIEVEALPDRLPEKFEVDVTHLAAVDEQITVADLRTGEGVTILTDGEQVVAKISELVSQEAEEQAAEEAAASEAAQVETSTEGESLAEETTGQTEAATEEK